MASIAHWQSTILSILGSLLASSPRWSCNHGNVRVFASTKRWPSHVLRASGVMHQHLKHGNGIKLHGLYVGPSAEGQNASGSKQLIHKFESNRSLRQIGSHGSHSSRRTRHSSHQKPKEAHCSDISPTTSVQGKAQAVRRRSCCNQCLRLLRHHRQCPQPRNNCVR